MATNSHPRKSVQETMALSRLPDDTLTSGSSSSSSTTGEVVQRFLSQSPAWKPGQELPWGSPQFQKSNRGRTFGPGAFGGHVYAQAPLAAARVVEEEEEKEKEKLEAANGAVKRKLGIHSIQGVFTNPGLIDRPFLYEVSTIASTRSFSTRFIKARQPSQPSSNPSGPFPVSDASLPMGDISFTCLTTFKRPVESPDDFQQTLSPQQRYASILSLKAPDEWPPSPQADVDIVTKLFPDAGHGQFPMLDMYKVDMQDFNAPLPISERRQIVYYRLHKPLPEDDTNAHIVTHAYESDRNGLIMLGNHLGYGFNMGLAASLSFSFYVHVNAEEAVMRGDGWWIQEVYWPRVSAGRAMMETRTWSPEGKLIASGYQDGIIMPGKSGKEDVKL